LSTRTPRWMSTSARSLPWAKRAIGYRLFPAKGGSPPCASTAHSSRGSTRPGGPARLRGSIGAVPRERLADQRLQRKALVTRTGEFANQSGIPCRDPSAVPVEPADAHRPLAIRRITAILQTIVCDHSRDAGDVRRTPSAQKNE
jgi:hypothetical protein